MLKFYNLKEDMNTIGTPFLWSWFIILLVTTITLDLFLQIKYSKKVMSMKYAVSISSLWVVIAFIFCATFWYDLDSNLGRSFANFQALNFITAYLIEKALAIDNIFVWIILFSYFNVPILFQHRILIYGALGAIIMRTIVVFVGNWLISQFKWLIYVLGIFLILTGAKIILIKNKEININEKLITKWLRHHLRIIDNFDKKCLFIRKNGLIYVTLTFLVLVLVEFTDLIFAIDSIPAVFAITADPFIILTSNLLSVLGLRAMYFLLVNTIKHFSMLKYGLSVILIFIGIKMLIVDFYPIPIIKSLSIVFGILIITAIINVIVANYSKRK